jgi:hypothetical protein
VSWSKWRSFLLLPQCRNLTGKQAGICRIHQSVTSRKPLHHLQTQRAHLKPRGVPVFAHISVEKVGHMSLQRSQFKPVCVASHPLPSRYQMPLSVSPVSTTSSFWSQITPRFPHITTPNLRAEIEEADENERLLPLSHRHAMRPAPLLLMDSSLLCA